MSWIKRQGKGMVSMKLDKWDERYLRIAKKISKWSKDPSSKVGAVIADDNGRVAALGFNGFPKNVHDTAERLSDRSKKYPRVVHAEANAAPIAGRAARGGTVYVYGRPICSHCAGILIQAGIQRVVAEPPRDGAEIPSCAPQVDWDE